MHMSCYQCPLYEFCNDARKLEYASKQFEVEVFQNEKHTERTVDFLEIAESMQPDMTENEERNYKLDLLGLSIAEAADGLDNLQLSIKATLDHSYGFDALLADEIDCPGPKKTKRFKLFGKAAVECSSVLRKLRADDVQEKMDAA